MDNVMVWYVEWVRLVYVWLKWLDRRTIARNVARRGFGLAQNQLTVGLRAGQRHGATVAFGLRFCRFSWFDPS